MNISPITVLLGAAVGLYFFKPTTRTVSFGTVPASKKETKFPGYEIKDQLINIQNIEKAKKFVFKTGETKPEGALFKLVFGADSLTYTDVKKDDTYSSSVNIIVKEKAQQDNVYMLLCYLFAGAFKQSPHRVGYYADRINNFTAYLKTMFNVDYPIIKSVDEAKVFFEDLGKNV